LKTPSNVKELCEFMWYLEDKYNLLDFEISGVKPWQAHRIEIYYELGRQIGVFEKELQRGLSKIDKFKSLFSLIKNSIFKNPLSNLKKVEKLIITHPRSKIVDGKFIDIYTHYFINDLLSNYGKFIEYEEHYNGNHIREDRDYKRYLDYINLMRNFKNGFISIRLNDYQMEVLNNLEKEIGEFLNIREILLKRVKSFLVSYPIYKKILEKSSPKEVYVVVSYGRSEIIKAAKDLGIKVIEFQHGTFSKYHLGYSYPNYNGDLDYFPNEFWVWNDYWKNLIYFPIPDENIKIYPFQYLENQKSRYSLKKIKNQMVVLCQGGLTDSMAKKILDNLEKFRNFKLIFKLHPEEYGRSHLYQNLIKLKSLLNIKIVEDVDLYKLLAESEYQAGVFSTALYEGIEFGCKTILFNLSGIEYMDKFIEMYGVEVI